MLENVRERLIAGTFDVPQLNELLFTLSPDKAADVALAQLVYRQLVTGQVTGNDQRTKNSLLRQLQWRFALDDRVLEPEIYDVSKYVAARLQPFPISKLTLSREAIEGIYLLLRAGVAPEYLILFLRKKGKNLDPSAVLSLVPLLYDRNVSGWEKPFLTVSQGFLAEDGEGRYYAYSIYRQAQWLSSGSHDTVTINYPTNNSSQSPLISGRRSVYVLAAMEDRFPTEETDVDEIYQQAAHAGMLSPSREREYVIRARYVSGRFLSRLISALREHDWPYIIRLEGEKKYLISHDLSYQIRNYSSVRERKRPLPSLPRHHADIAVWPASQLETTGFTVGAVQRQYSALPTELQREMRISRIDLGAHPRVGEQEEERLRYHPLLSIELRRSDQVNPDKPLIVGMPKKYSQLVDLLGNSSSSIKLLNVMSASQGLGKLDPATSHRVLLRGVKGNVGRATDLSGFTLIVPATEAAMKKGGNEFNVLLRVENGEVSVERLSGKGALDLGVAVAQSRINRSLTAVEKGILAGEWGITLQQKKDIKSRQDTQVTVGKVKDMLRNKDALAELWELLKRTGVRKEECPKMLSLVGEQNGLDDQSVVTGFELLDGDAAEAFNKNGYFKLDFILTEKGWQIRHVSGGLDLAIAYMEGRVGRKIEHPTEKAMLAAMWGSRARLKRVKRKSDGDSIESSPSLDWGKLKTYFHGPGALTDFVYLAEAAEISDEKEEGQSKKSISVLSGRKVSPTADSRISELQFSREESFQDASGLFVVKVSEDKEGVTIREANGHGALDLALNMAHGLVGRAIEDPVEKAMLAVEWGTQAKLKKTVLAEEAAEAALNWENIKRYFSHSGAILALWELLHKVGLKPAQIPDRLVLLGVKRNAGDESIVSGLRLVTPDVAKTFQGPGWFKTSFRYQSGQLYLDDSIGHGAPELGAIVPLPLTSKIRNRPGVASARFRALDLASVSTDKEGNEAVPPDVRSLQKSVAHLVKSKRVYRSTHFGAARRGYKASSLLAHKG